MQFSMRVNLVLLRHATAESKHNLVPDPQRRLTKSGKRESRKLAKVFEKFGFPPPHIIISSGYVRAEETLSYFNFPELTKKIIAHEFEPEGSPALAVQKLKSFLPAENESGILTLWIVGHNPNISSILNETVPSLSGLIKSFPKGGAVWLEWDDSLMCFLDSPKLRAFIPNALD